MKLGRPSIAAFLLVLTSLCAHAEHESDDPPGRVGRIGYLSGSVSFASDFQLGEWSPAKLNYPVTSGNRIYVHEDSRAEIQIGAAALRLAERSDLVITHLDDDGIALDLRAGRLNVSIAKLQREDRFEITSFNANFVLLRGGIYRLDVDPFSEHSVLTVRRGEAVVELGRSRYPVVSGRSAAVSGERDASFETELERAVDRFDDWSAQRDREIRDSLAGRYLSEDMTGYQELDRHGRWQEYAEYGPVWYPHHVPYGWAPYRYGHWAWVHPWGWTWIDDAPWGFAPFHFGRWVFVGGYWGWAPGRLVHHPVYAPALVVFIDHVYVSGVSKPCAWLPLAPHETYVPGYRHSPRYVQRINSAHFHPGQHRPHVRDEIGNYRNHGIKGAITAVTQEVLARGQPVAPAALRDPAIPRHVAVAREPHSPRPSIEPRHGEALRHPGFGERVRCGEREFDRHGHETRQPDTAATPHGAPREEREVHKFRELRRLLPGDDRRWRSRAIPDQDSSSHVPGAESRPHTLPLQANERSGAQPPRSAQPRTHSWPARQHPQQAQQHDYSHHPRAHADERSGREYRHWRGRESDRSQARAPDARGGEGRARDFQRPAPRWRERGEHSSRPHAAEIR